MRNFRSQHVLKILLSGLVFVMIGSILVMAWVPPVSRDALTHHLAVPKLYVKHGGMYEIPSIAYSYYPGNLDILYLVPLLYGNDILPKLIHFAFALLTAWLIFAHLKRRPSWIRIAPWPGGEFPLLPDRNTIIQN